MSWVPENIKLHQIETPNPITQHPSKSAQKSLSANSTFSWGATQNLNLSHILSELHVLA